MKKRGMLGRKKGDLSMPVYSGLGQMVLAFLIFLSLMAYVVSVGNDSSLEKQTLARDQALLINTLYAAPGDVKYTYANPKEGLNGFSFGYSSQVVEVTEKPTETLGKKTQPIPEQYPYATDLNEKTQAATQIKDKNEIIFAKEGSNINIG